MVTWRAQIVWGLCPGTHPSSRGSKTAKTATMAVLERTRFLAPGLEFVQGRQDRHDLDRLWIDDARALADPSPAVD